MDARGRTRGMHGEHARWLFVKVTPTRHAPFVQPPPSNVGSRVRVPAESGATMRARTSTKRQSALFSCHNCPTESRESCIDGRHRTPAMRKL
eukprot:6195688-Pleurochrysis_carterae.AAC.2